MRWCKVLEIRVPGDPKSKGSYTPVTSPSGKVFMMQSKSSKSWQSKVCELSQGEVEGGPYAEPIGLKLVFDLPRPKSHYRTGKRAGELKDSAPPYPDKIPDIDKLLRGIMDGLTRVLYDDDKRVVHVEARKEFSRRREAAGVFIQGWVWHEPS